MKKNSASDNIFPLILETLSTKPSYEETESNLFNELKAKMKEKGYSTKNLKKDFEDALEIGQAIGIFNYIQQKLQLPFMQKKQPVQPKEPPLNKERESVPQKVTRQNIEDNDDDEDDDDYDDDDYDDDDDVDDQQSNLSRSPQRHRHQSSSKGPRSRSRSVKSQQPDRRRPRSLSLKMRSRR